MLMIGLIVLVLGFSTATASASTETESVPDGLALPDVRLAVPDGLAPGVSLTSVDQLGSARVRTDVVSLNGGVIRVGADRAGGKAFDFPAFSTGAPSGAVLRVTGSETGGDPLAPGVQDFAFGADFRMDPRSIGSQTHNGDNLIQRGLFGQSQYKIQMDGGLPSCRVKGSQGSLHVRIAMVVDHDLWYRALCSRVGSSISLTIVEYHGDGSRKRYTATERGALGSVSWSRRETPLSVGGKLSSSGQVIRSSMDQFNGLVSNPVLIIDS